MKLAGDRWLLTENTRYIVLAGIASRLSRLYFILENARNDASDLSSFSQGTGS